MKRYHTNLRGSIIFEDISGDDIEALYGLGHEVTVEAHQILFERGDASDELIILLDGTVELLFPIHVMGVTREVAMESKQAGDVVAWSSVIRPYHFTLSARTVSQCQLIKFNRDRLFNYFEDHSKTGYLFMRNLASVIGRRLQAIQMRWTHDLLIQGSRGSLEDATDVSHWTPIAPVRTIPSQWPNQHA